MNNLTTFYLKKDVWTETCLKILSTIGINEETATDTLKFVQAMEIISGTTLVIEPCSLAAVPSELQTVVSYSVFGRVDDGLLLLLGWFNRKPRHWSDIPVLSLDRKAWEVYIGDGKTVQLRQKAVVGEYSTKLPQDVAKRIHTELKTRGYA